MKTSRHLFSSLPCTRHQTRDLLSAKWSIISKKKNWKTSSKLCGRLYQNLRSRSTLIMWCIVTCSLWRRIPCSCTGSISVTISTKEFNGFHTNLQQSRRNGWYSSSCVLSGRFIGKGVSTAISNLKTSSWPRTIGYSSPTWSLASLHLSSRMILKDTMNTLVNLTIMWGVTWHLRGLRLNQTTWSEKLSLKWTSFQLVVSLLRFWWMDSHCLICLVSRIIEKVFLTQVLNLARKSKIRKWSSLYLKWSKDYLKKDPKLASAWTTGNKSCLVHSTTGSSN